MTVRQAALPAGQARLLFVSHEANRTGAPILLLTFLTWLRRETDMAFDVLLLRDGPLRGDFAALAPTHLATEVSGQFAFPARLASRWRQHPQSHWTARAVEHLQRRGYDAVYGNSVLSLPWLVEFRAQGVGICLCHMHEMTWVISRLVPLDDVRAHLPTMNVVIACADAVASDLVRRFGVPATLINVVHSFVESDIHIAEPRDAVRRRLGIGADEFVIGAVGTPELRKGTDLIVRLALNLERDQRMGQFRIVWLGGDVAAEIVSICQLDAERLGVARRLLFVPHTAAPNDHINAFDALIVPSREEPFTLVALAAASLAKPIVGFADSGGIGELVGDDSGVVVPYLDVEAMADALVALRVDPASARRFGENARRKVAQRFTAEIVSRQLHALIGRSLAPAERAAPQPRTDLAPHGPSGS